MSCLVHPLQCAAAWQAALGWARSQQIAPHPIAAFSGGSGKSALSHPTHLRLTPIVECWHNFLIVNYFMILVGKMKSIQENTPILLGWLAYQVYTLALANIILLVIAFFAVRFDVPISNPFWLGPIYIINAAIGYLAFFVSVRWLASPLFLRLKNIANKSKRDFLIVEWITFTILVFAFTLPLSITGIIPVSKTIFENIAFAWKIIGSLFVCRSVVSGYVFDNAKTAMSENEQQETLA